MKSETDWQAKDPEILGHMMAVGLEGESSDESSNGTVELEVLEEPIAKTPSVGIHVEPDNTGASTPDGYLYSTSGSNLVAANMTSAAQTAHTDTAYDGMDGVVIHSSRTGLLRSSGGAGFERRHDHRTSTDRAQGGRETARPVIPDRRTADDAFGINFCSCRLQEQVYNLPSGPVFEDEDEFDQQMSAEFRVVEHRLPSVGLARTTKGGYDAKQRETIGVETVNTGNADGKDTEQATASIDDEQVRGWNHTFGIECAHYNIRSTVLIVLQQHACWVPF